MSQALDVRINDAEFNRAMKQKPVTVRREVDLALARAALEVGRLAKGKAPKAFSHLTNSIIPGKTRSLVHFVKAGMNYASDIEYGRAPGHMPDRQHIIDWMKIKGITPLNGSYKSSAFLIARSIAKHGSKAQPFMAPALEEKRPRILRLVKEGVRRGLDGGTHV